MIKDIPVCLTLAKNIAEQKIYTISMAVADKVAFLRVLLIPIFFFLRETVVKHMDTKTAGRVMRMYSYILAKVKLAIWSSRLEIKQSEIMLKMENDFFYSKL